MSPISRIPVEIVHSLLEKNLNQISNVIRIDTLAQNSSQPNEVYIFRMLYEYVCYDEYCQCTSISTNAIVATSHFFVDKSTCVIE